MHAKIRKTEIRNLTLEELANLMEAYGEKKFRARQIYDWAWRKQADSLEEMKNLPNSLRSALEQKYAIHKINLQHKQISDDNTVKFGFGLRDDALVEGVLIPSRKRTTACISSQVGCKLACTFCATAGIKFQRNLFPPEIVDQVTCINQESWERHGTRLSNIVMMGMGEPLLNTGNVLKAVGILTDDKALGFSPQRITLSTAGIVEEIKKLGDKQVRFNLAVSLNSAIHEKRSMLMPVSKSNPLPSLLKALRYFYHKTGTRITFEYILIDKVNDQPEDAAALANFCKQVPCKVNLIEYNPAGLHAFRPSGEAATTAFIQYLEQKNILVNLRKSRGRDIDAACGQLAGKSEKA